MAKYAFSDPTGIYNVLGSIVAFVTHGEMNAAMERAMNVHDEGIYQTAVAGDASKSLWRSFTSSSDDLLVAIRANDPEGCIEALDELRENLATIIGPER